MTTIDTGTRSIRINRTFSGGITLDVTDTDPADHRLICTDLTDEQAVKVIEALADALGDRAEVNARLIPQSTKLASVDQLQAGVRVVSRFGADIVVVGPHPAFHDHIVAYSSHSARGASLFHVLNPTIMIASDNWSIPAADTAA